MAYILKPEGEVLEVVEPTLEDIEFVLGGPVTLKGGIGAILIWVREDAEEIGMPLNAYATKEGYGMVFGPAVVGVERDFIGSEDPYDL